MISKKSMKALVAVLSLVLLIGSAVGILVSANEAKTPTIISNNVSYDGNYSLMYAVSADSVNEGAVTLKIYKEYPTESSAPVATYTAKEPEDITVSDEKVSAYVFITQGVAAKDMPDVFYAKAVDASGAESAVYTYSVAEYLLERLYGGYELTESQKALYTASLAAGATAQKVLINEKDADSSNDETLVTDYTYLTFPGGTVNGVSAKYHIVKKGETVTLAYTDELPEGTFINTLIFDYSHSTLSDITAVTSTAKYTSNYGIDYTVVSAGGIKVSADILPVYKEGSYYNSEIAGTRYDFSLTDEELLVPFDPENEATANGIYADSLYNNNAITISTDTEAYKDQLYIKNYDWQGVTFVNKTNKDGGFAYVFETDFTWVGGAYANSSDLKAAFFGFSNTNETDTGRSSYTYINYDKDDPNSMVLYDKKLQKNVTYNIRLEYFVGGITNMYLNGELVSSQTSSVQNAPTNYNCFAVYMRGGKISTNEPAEFIFDNVYLNSFDGYYDMPNFEGTRYDYSEQLTLDQLYERQSADAEATAPAMTTVENGALNINISTKWIGFALSSGLTDTYESGDTYVFETDFTWKSGSMSSYDSPGFAFMGMIGKDALNNNHYYFAQGYLDPTVAEEVNTCLLYGYKISKNVCYKLRLEYTVGDTNARLYVNNVLVNDSISLTGKNADKTHFYGFSVYFRKNFDEALSFTMDNTFFGVI